MAGGLGGEHPARKKRLLVRGQGQDHLRMLHAWAPGPQVGSRENQGVDSLPCAGPGSRAELSVSASMTFSPRPAPPHPANTIITHRLAGGEAPGGVAVHAWPRSKPILSALGLPGTLTLPPRLATSTEQHQHCHPGPCSQPVPPQPARHGLRHHPSVPRAPKSSPGPVI